MKEQHLYAVRDKPLTSKALSRYQLLQVWEVQVHARLSSWLGTPQVLERKCTSWSSGDWSLKKRKSCRNDHPTSILCCYFATGFVAD